MCSRQSSFALVRRQFSAFPRESTLCMVLPKRAAIGVADSRVRRGSSPALRVLGSALLAARLLCRDGGRPSRGATTSKHGAAASVFQATWSRGQRRGDLLTKQATNSR